MQQQEVLIQKENGTNEGMNEERVIMNESTNQDTESTNSLAPYFIGRLEQAPPYAIDNEFIKRGYRINFNTIKRTLLSLFMCHNETTNVWSHLGGAILFVGLIVYIAVWVTPYTLANSSALIRDLSGRENILNSGNK